MDQFLDLFQWMESAQQQLGWGRPLGVLLDYSLDRLTVFFDVSFM